MLSRDGAGQPPLGQKSSAALQTVPQLVNPTEACDHALTGLEATEDLDSNDKWTFHGVVSTALNCDDHEANQRE